MEFQYTLNVLSNGFADYYTAWRIAMHGAKREWFEDETFWEYYAPIMFESDRWAEAPAVAAGTLALAGLDRKAEALDILDLCCGMGRVAVELARLGHAVTGVDITQSYLAAAGELAAADRLALELVREDVRTFVRPAAYDLALNLYTSFGYFDNPADDLLFARNARSCLRPDGVFIIETLGKEIAVRDYTDGECFERDGWQVTTAYRVEDSWAGLQNRWTIEKGGEKQERSFVQRLYAGSELRELLLNAGFSRVELYGEWDRSPYDQHARELIAVARA